MKRGCTCHSHNGFLLERGYAELAQQRSLEGLTPTSECVTLDRSGSVSGLRRDEINMIFDDGVINEQHRRFLEQVS